MFLGSITWYWITNQGAHPWGRMVLSPSTTADCLQVLLSHMAQVKDNPKLLSIYHLAAGFQGSTTTTRALILLGKQYSYITMFQPCHCDCHCLKIQNKYIQWQWKIKRHSVFFLSQKMSMHTRVCSVYHQTSLTSKW